MKKAICCLIVVVLLAGLFLGCPKPAPAPTTEPIVLKSVVCVPTGIPLAMGSTLFAEWVEELTNGELVLDILGGPEVIPGLSQHEAVRTGAIDMAFTCTAFYPSLLPVADTTHLTELTLQEEHQRGYYDFMVREHMKVNIRYLGRWMPTSCMQRLLWTTRRCERAEDLVGLNINVASLEVEFGKALKVNPVNLRSAEMYTALQQGLLDGFFYPVIGVHGLGCDEIVRFCVDHGLYRLNGVILMNLDTWNSLPKHLQDLVADVLDYELQMDAAYSQVEGELRQLCMDQGVQFIKWSPADAEYYVDKCFEAGWAGVKESVSAEEYAEIRSMLVK